MKISIVTITYNAVSTIQDTLHSFQSQTYVDKEHVIIDGGSTDGTKEILNDNKQQFSHFVSEPDNGLYDALNKGIKAATGDIVGILHADDLFPNEFTLADIAGHWNTNIDAIYGDLNYVKLDGETIHRKWVSGVYKPGLFRKGWMPPHPTFYCRKELFEEYGYYNTDLKQAADYELMLRFIERYEVKIGYLPKVLSLMRVGGASNASIRNRINANKEDALAWKLNGLTPSTGFRLRKPLRKLGQFLK